MREIPTGCGVENNDSPRWDLIDLARWKLVPEWAGGGKPYIQGFKDAWVVRNKERIIVAAGAQNIPVELLAGTTWIEVGGDPNFIDRMAFEVRSGVAANPRLQSTLNWAGLKKFTAPAAKTSFGSISMQLRTAAETMGLDPSKMTHQQFSKLGSCLEVDFYNIDIVARHLRMLADYDKLQSPLTKEDARIIGARYNRGIGLSMEKLKEDLSYGNFIVNNWERFHNLVRLGHK